MSTVKIEQYDAVALVRLNNGVTNAVNPVLVADLDKALDEVQQAGYKALLLAGGPKFFSIGLDLPALLQLKRDDMAQFWYDFDTIIARLYAWPTPTLCAYQGHATAAGSILASACDFRLAAAGRPLFGFNELVIGLSVPLLTQLMLVQIIGSQKAAELMFSGRFVKPEEALTLGIVDGVFAPEELEARALEKLVALSALPTMGFKATKYYKTKFVLEQYEANRDMAAKAFLDCWFNSEVQSILTEAAKKF